MHVLDFSTNIVVVQFKNGFLLLWFSKCLSYDDGLVPWGSDTRDSTVVFKMVRICRKVLACLLTKLTWRQDIGKRRRFHKFEGLAALAAKRRLFIVFRAGVTRTRRWPNFGRSHSSRWRGSGSSRLNQITYYCNKMLTTQQSCKELVALSGDLK